MAYIMLPTPQRTPTGLEEFAKPFSEQLQLAMQNMLKTQMENQQRERNLQQAYQTSPELFSPDYAGAIKARGAKWSPLPGSEKEAYESKYGTKIPAKFLPFKGGLQPSINYTTGEITAKPEDPFNAYYKSLLAGKGEKGDSGIGFLPLSAEEAIDSFIKDNPGIKKEDIIVTPKPIPGRKGVAYYEATAPGAEKTKELQAKNIEEANIKRQIYLKDLNNFLLVDDVLQQARGTGAGRFGAGLTMVGKGLEQGTPLGQAVATHEAARKRLRVQLVRAAGDVGNINIVEQEAAELLIPTQWDAVETARLKRAYLQELGRAINNNDGNAIREVLNRAGVNYQTQTTQQPTGQGQQQGSLIGRFKVEVE